MARTGLGAPPTSEARLTWRAMGTSCAVSLVDPDALGVAMGVLERVAELERQWSRFLPDSDLSRVNAAAGRPVVVSPETAALVAAAVTWWDRTAGRFDPSVLPALLAAGYDRDLDTGHGPVGDGAPVPGCAGVVVDLVSSTVRLPAGTALDLGGIGKGAAVDRLVEDLRGVRGGLIDLGGDLRVWGDDPDGLGGWPVAVEDPRTRQEVALLGLREGAVATSTTLRRAWGTGARRAHHLIDPRHGRPAQGELVGASVVAPTATEAEVLAKAAVVSGTVADARSLLGDRGRAALLVPREGPLVEVGGFRSLCWTAPKEAA